MTKTTIHRSLAGFCGVSIVLTLMAGSASAQTTAKESIKGGIELTTEKLSGEVTYVEGNTLVVRLTTGDLRTFNVPESRRFVIDAITLASSSP